MERELSSYAFPTRPADWPEDRSDICTLRVTIDAAGRFVRSAPTSIGCPEPLRRTADEALHGWRWAPGDAETTETLNVPFRDPG